MRHTTLHASLTWILRHTTQQGIRLTTAAAFAGGLAMGISPLASAQQPPQAQRTTHDFDVSAGPLSAALLRFGTQSGLQFNVDSKLTDGKRSAGVHGKYSIEGGLAELLAGSGLTFRFAGPRTVVIETLPDVGGARVLGPLRVEGAGAGSAISDVNGVNGSTDITATEGTGSYTSGALGIASKTALSIKDTAQSVSVITHQRMIEQNITDFAQLMNQATGISTITTGNGPLQAEYYSRGFRIQRMQLDGGAPLDIADENFGMVPQLDMAIYDHAEILRGADGLFNGYGDPGGVISLSRKRPLDHFQTVVEAQVGSWANYRATLDVTGPLAQQGRLRGRGVLVWQDQNYFYDVASNRKKLAYGVLEYDLTPSTVVSAGVSYTKQDSVPAVSGLPRYYNGDDLNLSRSTSFTLPWNRYAFDTTEVFGRVEQTLGEYWNLKLNAAHTKQERSWIYGGVSGAVNPVTLAGPVLSQSMGDGASTQTTADLTLDGSFELFGHRQKLVVGANYAKADGAGLTEYTAQQSDDVDVDVMNFNPNDPAYQANMSGVRSLYYPEYLKSQWGAYATLQLTLWEPLHLNVGVRHSRIKRSNEYWTYCTTASGCLGAAFGERRSIISSKYDTKDTSWPPSVSLVYDVNKTVSVYASYTDIYQEQAVSLDMSGKALDPMTGSNIEAGIKWAGRDGRLNTTFSIYRVEQNDVASYVGRFPGYVSDGVHSCCYTTDTDLTRLSKGADLEVTGEVLPGWQLAASYTWNDNKEEGNDSYRDGLALQTRLPKHLIKLWSGYQFQEGTWLQRVNIGAGVNAQSRGDYRGTTCLRFEQGTGTCVGGTARYNFSQGFYAVFSARAAYQIDDRWQLALNINNLLDRRYYQTIGNAASGNWYGEPRNYTLTLRGQF